MLKYPRQARNFFFSTLASRARSFTRTCKNYILKGYFRFDTPIRITYLPFFSNFQPQSTGDEAIKSSSRVNPHIQPAVYAERKMCCFKAYRVGGSFLRLLSLDILKIMYLNLLMSFILNLSFTSYATQTNLSISTKSSSSIIAGEQLNFLKVFVIDGFLFHAFHHNFFECS